MGARSLLLVAALGGCDAAWGGDAPRSAPGRAPERVLEPAPLSASYPGVDAFEAAERAVPPRAGVAVRQDAICLAGGEVVEVLRRPRERRETFAGDAFYVPPEADGIVCLTVETEGMEEVFLLRGIAPGETLGGVVARRWVDDAGRRPRSVVDEARIQAALKTAPRYIVVE